MVNPKSLENLIPASPGEIRNPLGRKTAGAVLREELNSIVYSGMTEAQVRKIAKDKDAPMNRRAAALRYLRLVETGDLADMEEWLQGGKTLKELRDEGHNTEILKSAKISDKGGRSIELRDTAREEFINIAGQTDGLPTQRIEADVSVKKLLVDDL